MSLSKDMILGAIRASKTKQEVENAFSTANITDCEERISYLLEAMYNPKTFFSNENPTQEQRYIMIMEMFLTFEWKMTEIFRSRGIC